MTIALEPKVVTTAYDHVDWHSGTDTTLLYDRRFLFPVEELAALARAHARCPGLVHRELRRHMDAEDVARVLALDANGVGGSGGGSGSTAGFSVEYGATRTSEGDAGFCHEPAAGYVTVEEPDEELDDYVMVGTAEEVERERRLEADAEAGSNDRVRSIEELLLENAGVDEEDAAHDAGGKFNHDVPSVEQISDFLEEEDEDAITARRKKLIRDIDRSLEEEEEEAAHEPGLNNVARTIEQHFACADNEAAVPE